MRRLSQSYLNASCAAPAARRLDASLATADPPLLETCEAEGIAVIAFPGMSTKQSAAIVRRRAPFALQLPAASEEQDYVPPLLERAARDPAVARRYMTMMTLLHPPGREVTSGEEVLLQAAS